jgi:hypothetical protein
VLCGTLSRHALSGPKVRRSRIKLFWGAPGLDVFPSLELRPRGSGSVATRQRLAIRTDARATTPTRLCIADLCLTEMASACCRSRHVVRRCTARCETIAHRSTDGGRLAYACAWARTRERSCVYACARVRMRVCVCARAPARVHEWSCQRAHMRQPSQQKNLVDFLDAPPMSIYF